VLLWAIGHARELSDVDNFDAYLAGPLEIAYALKPLEQAAAEARARRLALQAATTPAGPPAGIPTVPPPQQQIALDVRMLAWIGGGIVVLVLVLLWKRRQSGGMAV
jgi:hypothetical protein